MSASPAISGSPGAVTPEGQILRKVWELSLSAIVVTDPSGDIEYVNPAFEKVTGYSSGEVVGRNPRILKSGTQSPEVYAGLWSTITSGGTWTGRLQNRRKDGSLYWEALTITPMCDAKGKILHYIALKKNVTAEEESQQRYALTLEAVNDAVWDWNLATGTAFFSPKYYSMLGYDDGEFPATYKSWRSLVHPEDLDRIEGELLRNIDSGKGYAADIRMKSKSGEWIWISTRGNIVEHDAQGKPLRMLGMHTDITLHKRAEEEISRQSTLLNSLLDSDPDIVFFKNTEGVYLGCNPAFVELVGRPRNEVVGKTDHDLFDKQVADFFREQDRRTMRRRETRHNEEWVTYPDGRKALLDTMKTPYWGPSGELIGVLGISCDITLRKRAEEALLKSSEEFRAMFELASIGMAQCDPQTGQWVRVNQKMCQITGYTAAEMLEMHVPEITHPDDRQMDFEEFQRVVRGELPSYHLEKRYVRKDGAVVWVSVNMTVIRDAAGKPVRTMATIEDLTERKLAEAERELALDRLSLATKAGRVGIWDYDIVNNKLVWDDQMFSLYRIPRESFGGAYEAWKAGLHPEDVQREHQGIQMAISGEKDFDAEFRVIWPDGSIRNIRALAIVQRSPSGVPLRMIGTNWDITERKSLEEALLLSERRTKELLSSVTDYIYTVHFQNGTVGSTAHGPGCLSVTGYSSEDYANDPYLGPVRQGGEQAMKGV